MGIILYSVIILDLIGFFICIYLVFRHKRKAKAIKHYEDVRDKLTFREAEKEVTSEAIKETCKLSLGSMIGTLIVIGVIISVGTTVMSELDGALSSEQYNVALPAQQALMDGIPILFILGLIATGIAILIQGLRSAGIMGV